MVTSLIFGFIIIYTLFVFLRAHRKYRVSQAMLDREEVYRLDSEAAEIAQDIHDEVSSGLALITIQVNQLESVGAGPDDLTAIRTKLIDLGRSLSRATRQLSAHDLRGEGFYHSVSEIISRCRETRALKIDFRYELDDEPPDEVGIQLYRIILELIQNVVRHAEATQVKLWIRVHEGKFCLLFSDNGKGLMKDDGEKKRGGMGRSNIRKRVNLVKGRVWSWTQPGMGTEYFIEIPIRSTYYETNQIVNSG